MASKDRDSHRTEWLKKEAAHWVEQGILSSSQAERILSLYPPPEEQAETDPTRFLLRILILLAVALVGVGVILFFAAVWGHLAAAERIAIVLAGFTLAQGARIFIPLLREGWLAREGGELAVAFLFGLCIFQIDRNLQLNIYTTDLLILWTLGISIPLLLSRAESVVILVAVLTVLWVLAGLRGGWWEVGGPPLYPGEALRFYGFLPFWLLAIVACGMRRPVGIAALGGAFLVWLVDLPHYWPPGVAPPGLHMFWLLNTSYFGFVGACFWLVSTGPRELLPGWLVIRALGILLAANLLIAKGFLRFPDGEQISISNLEQEIALWLTLLATLGVITGLVWGILRLGWVGRIRPTSEKASVLTALFSDPSWKTPAGLVLLFGFYFLGELVIGAIWFGSEKFLQWRFLATEIPWIICFSATAATVALAISFLGEGQRHHKPTWIGLAAVYIVLWILVRLGDCFGLGLREAASIFFSAALGLAGVYLLGRRSAHRRPDTPIKAEAPIPPAEPAGKTSATGSWGQYLREHPRIAIGAAFLWQVAVLVIWTVVSFGSRLLAVWIVEIPVKEAWHATNPFRGAYLTLKFPFTEVPLNEIDGLKLPIPDEEIPTFLPAAKIEALQEEKLAALRGQTAYLLFDGDDQSLRPAGLSVHRPEKGPFIRGTISSVWQGPPWSPKVETNQEETPSELQQQKPEWWATITFGIERISVPQSTSSEWMEAIRAGRVSAKVAISPSGRAFILQLQKSDSFSNTQLHSATADILEEQGLSPPYRRALPAD